MQTVTSTELQGQITDFINDCTDKTKADCQNILDSTVLSITITDVLTDDTAGSCTTYKDKTKKILIDRATCEQSYIECKILIYHELGHCLFNLEHTESGLMAKQMYNKQVLENNSVEFIEEFWKSVNNAKVF
jgi:hypothetical protein